MSCTITCCSRPFPRRHIFMIVLQRLLNFFISTWSSLENNGVIVSRRLISRSVFGLAPTCFSVLEFLRKTPTVRALLNIYFVWNGEQGLYVVNDCFAGKQCKNLLFFNLRLSEITAVYIIKIMSPCVSISWFSFICLSSVTTVWEFMKVTQLKTKNLNFQRSTRLPKSKQQ